jgi:dihydroflavonol-4-reductase
MGYEWTRHRGESLSDFERSKVESERMALKLRSKGIDVVVVNPSLVLAPGDMGWVGRLMARAVSGGMRFGTDAPMSWISADDAAQGMIRALEAGTNGERYILSAERMTLRQLFERVAAITGRKPARAWSAAALDTMSKLCVAVTKPFGKRPLLAPDEVRFLVNGLRVDGAWARGELGAKYGPLAATLPGIVQSYQRALERFGT